MPVVAGAFCWGIAGLMLLADLHADSVTSAQPPANGASYGPASASVADVASDRAEILERLASVQKSIDQLQSSSRGVPDHLAEQLELLKWIDLILSQREAKNGRKTELLAEQKRTQKELATLRAVGPTNTGPQSFLQLDEARDQLSAEQSRSETTQLEIDALKASLSMERESYDNAEKKRRQAREALEMASDPAAKESLSREHMLAKLTSRAHREALRQQELELEIVQLEHEISMIRVDYSQVRVEQLRSAVQFPPEDLRTKLAVLDKAEAQLRQQLAELRANSRHIDRQRLEATRELKNSGEEDAVFREKLRARKLARELQQEQISVLNRVVAYVGLVRTCWRQRYELANGQASAEDVRTWHDEIISAREQLARFEQLIEIRADERLSDLATLQKRLIVLEKRDEGLGHWVQQQADELEDSIGAYGSQLVLIKSGQRLIDRFAEEVEQAVETNSASEWLAYAGQLFQACWNYEIAAVDDRPITVSKVVRGIILLLGGFLLARLFSRLLGKRLLPRLGMNQGASQALQTISFYLMLTCCGFIALELVNLPLTVFAFLGGAIAIGVGFGSQNVLNNFISGLILLAERPIRVGDLVEIDGLNGTIERIGARSTQVRTGSNLEIIVPNSKFLENNVTNWTLSNTRIRTMVTVGVAYGSPTREVSRLVRQAVTEHQAVIQDPKPIILFKDFGDNALLFEVHFWLHMRTIMEAEAVASEVRHTIDDLFKESNITIAFPQRDVHLDATAPIEVNVRQIEEKVRLREEHEEAA